MGSKTVSLENLILLLIFNNVAIPNIGDASGLQPSASDGFLYIGLMTDAAVCDNSNEGVETNYTGYSRTAVPRDNLNWLVSGNNATNINSILFGVMTAGGPLKIRYINIYTAASGGTRLYWGQLDDDLDVVNGIAPELDPGTLDINED